MISSGDGGLYDDPARRAQTDCVFGKLLRIDVDSPPAAGTAAPADPSLAPAACRLCATLFFAS